MTKEKGQKNRQHNGQRKRTKGQTTQWPKKKGKRTNNTMAKEKGQKDRQHNNQRKRAKGQTTQWPKKKGKRTNNDLQNTIQKTKDRATRTPLKTGVSSGAPVGRAVPVPLVAPIALL
jgi:hypothetical protein